MTDDKPTCQCNSNEEHVASCVAHYGVYKPTGLTDEQIIETVGLHIRRCRCDEQPEMGGYYVALNNGRIDKCCHAERLETARRIEAIVRADQPSRASTMEHDIELMIRKDERERAAKVAPKQRCTHMTDPSEKYCEDCWADAILRGEE